MANDTKDPKSVFRASGNRNKLNWGPDPRCYNQIT